MRFTIKGDRRDEEVIAEEVEIIGSGHQFALHRTIGDQANQLPWTVSHVVTGLAVARGATAAAVIAAARSNWSSKTPAEIQVAIRLAADIDLTRTPSMTRACNGR